MLLNQNFFATNIVDKPRCQCGEVELTKHFLLECLKCDCKNTYVIPSKNVRQSHPSLKILISGGEHLAISALKKMGDLLLCALNWLNQRANF